jgi:tRNA 2-thiouridine synthesizing protein A
MTDAQPDRLDLQGLKCPLPALRARKVLAGLPSGRVLVVEATDPMAAIDIPNMLREEGHALEAQTREGAVIVFRIRRG